MHVRGLLGSTFLARKLAVATTPGARPPAPGMAIGECPTRHLVGCQSVFRMEATVRVVTPTDAWNAAETREADWKTSSHAGNDHPAAASIFAATASRNARTCGEELSISRNQAGGLTFLASRRSTRLGLPRSAQPEPQSRSTRSLCA